MRQELFDELMQSILEAGAILRGELSPARMFVVEKGKIMQVMPARLNRMTEITHFHGDHFFLSNFYPSAVEWEGQLYPTVEHAFQAAKTLDAEERAAVQYATTAAQAKQIGRHVSLRPDWEQVKYDVMHDLLRKKFSDPELAARLLATGDANLIEGNTWNDKTWGCVKYQGEWIGKNWLGKLLMGVRNEIGSASRCPRDVLPGPLVLDKRIAEQCSLATKEGIA